MAMRSMEDIAKDIRADWKKMNPYAEAYLNTFGKQNDEDAIRYFLCNAQGWHGPNARVIKKELAVRLREIEAKQ